MQQCSWRIRDEMGGQELGEDLEKNGENGMTVSVRRQWTRDDEDEWPDAAEWIKEQFERLHAAHESLWIREHPPRPTCRRRPG